MAHEQFQHRVIRENSHPRMTTCEEDASLFDLIGNSRLVLIGETSHETHEVYRKRAHIVKGLIQKKGFSAVAAEADWPDAHGVNRRKNQEKYQEHIHPQLFCGRLKR